jgi:signal transduction histidine kinase
VILAALLLAAGLVVEDAAVIDEHLAPVRVAWVDALESSATEPPNADAAWTPLSLPHRWAGSSGDRTTNVWYRARLELVSWSGGDLAVYLPKVSMNAELWLNGSFAARIGSIDDPITRHWNTPLLLTVSALLLRAGPNELALRVHALDGHAGGLAPFWVGTVSALQPRADTARFWRVTLLNGLVTCVLALAFVVVIVWARRPERLDYLYFSLGAIGCAVSSLNMTVSSPPMSDHAWEVLVHGALHFGVICLALFGWQFAGVSTKRRRWLLAAVFAIEIVVLAALDGASYMTTIATMSFVLFAIALVAFFSLARRLRQQPFTDGLVFGIAAVATVGVGFYDWLVVSGWMPYEAPYALPYVWPVLLGAFSWLIAGEYARSQRDLADLNAQLRERIAAREAALQHTYEQLRAAERAQASAQERARILRDMHDGVGAHLATALRQLETGQSSRAEVALALRDSLDSLKLSIDGMTLMAGDVTSLLAALRYRLAPRLEGAGLSVTWQVDELPTWERGRSDGQMRHLQFLLFELVSNVVQHARASVLTVSARATAEAIELEIRDDGRGVPPDVTLRSSTNRAEAIGARLDREDAHPGTRIVVRLPLASRVDQ